MKSIKDVCITLLSAVDSIIMEFVKDVRNTLLSEVESK